MRGLLLVNILSPYLIIVLRGSSNSRGWGNVEKTENLLSSLAGIGVCCTKPPYMGRLSFWLLHTWLLEELGKV
jgi:hypothetical protein